MGFWVWVSQLLALLPLDLVHIIIKESEEKMNEYIHIKEILVERFKMKSEIFRLRFTQHQRKSEEVWKELVVAMRNYLEAWLDGVSVKDFYGLKNPMITYQIKRVCHPNVKDYFLDEWAKIVDPSELAEKLDEYESVRCTPEHNFPKASEQKHFEKI